MKNIKDTSIRIGAAGAADTASSIFQAIGKLSGESGQSLKTIRAIGIAANRPDLEAVAVELKRLLGTEVYSGDPSSAAAYAELCLNKNIDSAEALYMYSDLGIGVVLRGDGSILTGADSRYLMGWGSALGIVSLAKADVARGIGTVIVKIAGADTANITVEAVAEAASQKDEVALSIIRSVGINLGLRTAYLINLFAVKDVLIGGGVEKAGNFIADPMKKVVNKLARKEALKDLKLSSGVLGERAVGKGAALLAARELFLRS